MYIELKLFFHNNKMIGKIDLLYTILTAFRH